MGRPGIAKAALEKLRRRDCQQQQDDSAVSVGQYQQLAYSRQLRASITTVQAGNSNEGGAAAAKDRALYLAAAAAADTAFERGAKVVHPTAPTTATLSPLGGLVAADSHVFGFTAAWSNMEAQVGHDGALPDSVPQCC